MNDEGGDARKGRDSMVRRSVGRRWNLVALLLATVTAAVVALAPLATVGTDHAVPPPPQLGSDSTDHEQSSADTEPCPPSESSTAPCEVVSRVSLLSDQGSSVLVVLLLPVAVVVLPLLIPGDEAARRVRIGVVVILGVLTFLAMFSVGIFFLPTLVAMVLSVTSRISAPPQAVSGPPLS